MDRFWNSFEKRALEKEAIFAAGALHLAQNEGMKKLLSNPAFGQSVGKHFTHGLLGLQERFGRLKAFGRGFTSAATIPDIDIMRSHAKDLGGQVREYLRQKGITSIPAEALKGMQDALRAGPAALHQATDPYIVALREQMAKHPTFSHALKAGKAVDYLARSREHPLVSNIATNLIQLPKAGPKHYPLPQKVPMHQGYSVAGHLAGSAATGLVDLPSGVMNAFKSVSSHPTSRRFLDRFAPTRKTLGWIDRKLVNEPIQRAAQAGASGKPLNRAYNFANTHLFNPVIASAENTANKFYNVAR